VAVLITYTTESGDDGVVGVFERAPTAEEQMAIIEKYLPEWIDDGQSYAFLDWHDVSSDVLPIPPVTETSKKIESL
jgi:hypothetical protein